MRLPEDRTERIKILVLIAVAAIGVVFMLVTVIVKPLLSGKSKRREEITVLSAKLKEAEADVGRMLTERDSNIGVLEEIVDVSNRQGYILEPRLGNYQLGAHEYLEAVAQEVGVTLTAVQELGITLLPVAPEAKTEHAMKSYNLHVALRAGLHDLHRLLSVLETRNPYVVVSGITIAARADDNALHEVGLDVQWPIWADPLRSSQLEQRLNECRASQAGLDPAPGG